MKVVINASVLESEGGVALLGELLNRLPESQPETEVVLYLNPDLLPRFEWIPKVFPQLQLVSFHPGGGWPRLRWEQAELPRLLKKLNADLLVSFANTGPLWPGCPQVLYVQQAIPYADYTPPTHRLRWAKVNGTFRLLMGLSQLGASRIVVPTRWLIEPMRRSVFNRVPESTYIVSPPGLPSASDQAGLQPQHYSEQQRHEDRLIESLKKYRAKGQAILFYPCFLTPYKHLPYLIQAIHWLERQSPPPFKVVLTVDRQSPEYFPCKRFIFDTLQRLNPQHVLLAGSLSRHAMTRAYEQSDVLLFPSLVETLGLPLLEALAHELPVVATQTPFAREICRESALYANPEDPSDFGRKIKQVLEDAPLRQSLITQAGLQRARFDWETHIQAVFGPLET